MHWNLCTLITEGRNHAGHDPRLQHLTFSWVIVK